MAARYCVALGALTAVTALPSHKLHGWGAPEPLTEGSICVSLPSITVSGRSETDSIVYTEDQLKNAKFHETFKHGDKVIMSLHQTSSCRKNMDLLFRGSGHGKANWMAHSISGNVDESISKHGQILNMDTAFVIKGSPAEDCAVDLSDVTICEAVLPPPPFPPPPPSPYLPPPSPPPSTPPPSPPPSCPPPSPPPKPPPSSPPSLPPPSPPPPPPPPPPPCGADDVVTVVHEKQGFYATCACPDGEVFHVGGTSRDTANWCINGNLGTVKEDHVSEYKYHHVNCGLCPA